MSSRSITPADYASAASNRQSLPALSRRPAITSDSVIPRQILSGTPPAAGGSGPRPRPAALQVAQDRALGPVVAVAGVRQLLQGVPHGGQLQDPGLELGDVGGRDPLHVGAGPPAVVPEADQQPDALDGEPEV